MDHRSGFQGQAQYIQEKRTEENLYTMPKTIEHGEQSIVVEPFAKNDFSHVTIKEEESSQL